MSKSVSHLEALKGILRKSGAPNADDATARDLLETIEAAAETEIARQDPDSARTTRTTGIKKNK